ncbi:hypothetical protein [Actinoplanes sichuanensis]|uniref:Transposase n=1 Tax=Actinoplanes sichuanensis TaxID=512349 RepID=A0ABW4ACG4_9ACTN|nr:hypothetical protein [Actinoplanes sichuanensis]
MARRLSSSPERVGLVLDESGRLVPYAIVEDTPAEDEIVSRVHRPM